MRFREDTSDGVKDTVDAVEGVLRLIEDAVDVMHRMTDDEAGTAVCLFPAELDD